jgi:cholesterol oxidase
MPTWLWPMRNNISVHPLGGCSIANNAQEGVVSANTDNRGQVFGYKGLYVADGSVIPTSLGADPAATISAISEWIAQGIVANPEMPSDNLHQSIK